MTDMKLQLDTQRAALLALELCSNEIKGNVPTLLEVELWRCGKLKDKQRAEEVLSHIANTDEAYDLWRQLCESDEQLQAIELESSFQPQPQPLFASHKVSFFNRAADWFKSVTTPATAGIAFAGLLGAFIVPQLLMTQNTEQQLSESYALYQTHYAFTDNLNFPAQQTKDLSDLLGSAVAQDPARYHMRLGFREFIKTMNWQQNDTIKPWFAQLPTEPLDCSKQVDIKSCQATANYYTELGQWSLLTHSACQQDKGNLTVFWDQQHTLLTSISKEREKGGDKIRAIGNDKQSLCQFASTLVSQNQ